MLREETGRVLGTSGQEMFAFNMGDSRPSPIGRSGSPGLGLEALILRSLKRAVALLGNHTNTSDSNASFSSTSDQGLDRFGVNVQKVTGYRNSAQLETQFYHTISLHQR